MLGIICAAVLTTAGGGLVSADSDFENLSFGMQEDRIINLHEKLTQLGYYSQTIDDIYGNGTKSAVTSFQRRNGLAETGIVDEETLYALYSEGIVGAPEPA